VLLLCFFSAQVGKSFVTPISLGVRCIGTSVFHEIIHSFGFYHEQSRTDRDDHIRIDFTKLPKGEFGFFECFAKCIYECFCQTYNLIVARFDRNRK